MRPQNLFLILAIAALAAAAPPAALSAEATAVAKISFTKVFPNSNPEYTFVAVKETGEATIDIRQMDDPAHPDSVMLSHETTARIFALAAALNYFRGHPNWEPKQRVAAMGQKTLIYEKGRERNEVTFNYAMVEEVHQLVELLEGVGRTWNFHERITHALSYDRLSLLDLVRGLEAEFNRGYLAEPALLVPVLRRLVNDSRVLHLVQTKAQRLLERIGDTHATVSFSRTIDSVPSVYLALSVRDDGQASYEIRTFDATPAPQALALHSALTAHLFALAESLNYFRTEPSPGLENNAGASERTTFTYERAAESHQIRFTRTTHPALRELTSLAERILRQQWHRQNLEKCRTEPERIGPALALLDEEIRQGRLIDPAELTALLNELAADARLPAAAQRQALELAARLRK